MCIRDRYRNFQAVVPPRARFTFSMNILAGIFDCVRTHCGVRVAFHTWYLGAGITYVSIWSTFMFWYLVPDAFVVVWRMYDTWYPGQQAKKKGNRFRTWYHVGSKAQKKTRRSYSRPFDVTPGCFFCCTRMDRRLLFFYYCTRMACTPLWSICTYLVLCTINHYKHCFALLMIFCPCCCSHYIYE